MCRMQATMPQTTMAATIAKATAVAAMEAVMSTKADKETHGNNREEDTGHPLPTASVRQRGRPLTVLSSTLMGLLKMSFK